MNKATTIILVLGAAVVGVMLVLSRRSAAGAAQRGAAVTGAVTRNVTASPRLSVAEYLPPGYTGPPWAPLTNETDPKNARRTGFVAGCSDALQVGGAAATLAGGPKGAVAGTAMMVGAPYACTGIKAVGDAAKAVGKFFSKLF